jgi:hypothetical protein
MRTRLMRGKFTLLFMMLGLLLAVPAIAFAQDVTGSTTSPVVPTITSDLPDYPPGATVNLTGSKWQPGESVHINVNDDVGQSWSYDSNPDVIADESGNISHSFTLPNWFVATYTVTATGGTSGVATYTFTDQTNTDTTVSRTLGTDPSVSGDLLTFKAKVTENNSTTAITQGTVTFGEGANCGGGFTNQFASNVALNSSGEASASTSNRSLGSHEIRACYNGFGSGGSAINSSGGSMTQVVNPRPPTNLTATANGQNQIDLSWTGSADSANITSYVVFEGTTVKATPAKTATSASITGLAAGSTHTYTIIARYTDTTPNPDVNYDSTTATATATTASADATPPSVSSIKRVAGSTNPTNNSSVDWTVTFSESVSGVDTADFETTNTGTLSGTSVTGVSSGSGNTRTVTTSTGSGDGTLRLDLKDNDTIVDGAGNKLGGTDTTTTGNGSRIGDEVYTIDRTGPSVTLTNVNGSSVTFPYITNQTVSSVGGTCENGGSNVTVKVDGTADTATAPCSSGNWSLTLTTPRSSDGTYGFVAYQNDALGTPGDSGASKSVQVDKTAPTVTPSADRLKADSSVDGSYQAGNWTNQSVRVTFTCADNTGGSGLSAASGPQTLPDFTTNTSGATANFTGTCTDKAGNPATSTLSFGPIKIDKSPPTVTASAVKGTDPNYTDGTYTAGSWTNKDVKVTFDCADVGPSGLTAGSADQNKTFTANTTSSGATATFDGTCVDEAGNTPASPAANFGPINIDKDKPVISASAKTLPGGADYTAGTWTNKDVEVSFSCADDLSGTDTNTLTGATKSASAADQSVTNGGNCTDKAGNSADSKTFSDIDIDKDKPVISASATTDPGGANYTAGTWTNKDVKVSFSCTDTLSGTDTNTVAGDTKNTTGENQSVTNGGNCTDKAGNSADSKTFSDIDIDKDKPVIAATGTVTGTAGNLDWYKSAIDVEFRASDGLSGFANKTDPYKFTVGSGTQQGSNVSVNTSSVTVTDQAGNVADSASSGPFKVDYTAPTLNPSVNPNTIIVGGNAIVSANASDPTPGSSLASSSCGALNTATVTLNGTPRSVSCTATDVAGNSDTKSASYTVIYGFDVTSAGFLQPINYTAHQTATTAGTDVSTFKAGSTVPVKFVLKDANGNVVQTASAPQWMTPNKGNATNQLVDEPVYTETPTAGGSYKWDGSQYQYNWGTAKSGAGFYWRIGVKLEDGQTYFVNISLK